jgi:hypothetical protein
LVLLIDGELRRSRLYRAHEQAELSCAIAETGGRSRRRAGADMDFTDPFTAQEHEEAARVPISPQILLFALRMGTAGMCEFDGP